MSRLLLRRLAALKLASTLAERGRLYRAPPPPPTFRRTGPKVGRNEPCPCGSFRKFKKCHGDTRS
jgi:preprotein translocase subunit SecA